MKKKNIAATGSALAQSAKSVVIEQPRRLSVGLEVSGTAPLIQNRFSQKAIEEMLRKHMGISVQREKKKPREVLENATIRNKAGLVCMPPTAFKCAMLSASGGIKGLKKTQLRTQMFIEGNSIPIEYEGDMVPRMDMVRTSGMSRTPDVRFRPMFEHWKARLIIEFDDVLSVQTIVDLLNRGGSVGIGEWRPEKNGTFGTFRVTRHISTPKEIAEVREQCAVAMVTTVIPEWAIDANIDPELLKQAFDEGDEEDEAGEEAAQKRTGTKGARR